MLEATSHSKDLAVQELRKKDAQLKEAEAEVEKLKVFFFISWAVFKLMRINVQKDFFMRHGSLLI